MLTFSRRLKMVPVQDTGNDSSNKELKHDYSEVLMRGDDVGPVEAFHEKPRLTEPTWTGIALLKHRVMQEEFGTPSLTKKNGFCI